MSVIDLFQVSFKAGGALGKFNAVGLVGGSGKDYTVCNTVLETIGICQRDVASGNPAPVMLHGISRALAGAAVNPGDKVTNGGSGYLIAATSGAATPQYILGDAYTTAASGMIFHLHIRRGITGATSGGAA